MPVDSIGRSTMRAITMASLSVDVIIWENSPRSIDVASNATRTARARPPPATRSWSRARGPRTSAPSNSCSTATRTRSFGWPTASSATRPKRRRSCRTPSYHLAQAGHVQGRLPVRSWLYRVAANAALMRLRSQRRHPEVSTEDLPVGYLDNYGQLPPVGENWSKRPDDELQSEELRRHIQTAVDALPEIYRTVFLIRDVEGLSTEETGEVLHLGADREDTAAPGAHRAAGRHHAILRQTCAGTNSLQPVTAGIRYNRARP